MAEQEMLLDSATIKAAVAGEKWATEKVIEHYAPMIDELAVDEDMKQHLYEAVGSPAEFPDGAGIKAKKQRRTQRPYSPRARLFALPRLLTVLLLITFFLNLFSILKAQDPIHIVLDRQQLPHGGAGLPVLGVSLFLVCQQLGVLGLKLLDGGQLFHVQLYERLLGGLVQQDFFF